MQTFITDFDLTISMQQLDSQRLNKQMLESLQIAQYLTGQTLLKTFNPDTPHKNHPIVKMWLGYEPYFNDYMIANSVELIRRGLAIGSHMHDAVKQFGVIVGPQSVKQIPGWLDSDFIKRHKEALLYKSLMKLLIYRYSSEERMPISKVAMHQSFQNKYKDLFVSFQHAPLLTSNSIASARLLVSAQAVYGKYVTDFGEMFPLNVDYVWEAYSKRQV